MSIPVEIKISGKPHSVVNPLFVDGGGVVYRFPLVLDTAAYVAGDVLSDVVELKDVVAESGRAVFLHSIFVTDDDDQGANFDILFFSRPPVPAAKNAAWTTTDQQMWHCQEQVQITSYIDNGANRISSNRSIGSMILCESTSLWIATISQGTGTYTANGLRLKIGLVR